MRISPRNACTAIAAILLIAAGVAPARDAEGNGRASIEWATRNAIAADDRIAAAARQQLRHAGADGLAALLAAHEGVLRRGPSDPSWAALAAAIDRVAAQRDAWASRLYWHTDLAQARAEARRLGRPILSLRLLGRLDEELSCANSRYFRVALYANADVRRTLADRFVLHWSSERPAPRITIDYGDGRVVERTITGNSVHYVLDEEGRVVDALPGLYGPGAFRRALGRAEELALATRGLEAGARDAELARLHRARLAGVEAERARDEAIVGALPVPPRGEGSPDAFDAGRLAMTKMAVERPALRHIVRRFEPAAPDETAWSAAGSLHLADARLDASSLALMRLKSAGRWDAAAQDEAAFRRRVAAFERSMAMDGVRNEYDLHAEIHRWFDRAGGGLELEALNRRIYDGLFLTPAGDPWLGLVEPDSYAAIEREGIL